MKRSYAILSAMGLLASPVFSLEPPEKVAPLAPNQAPAAVEPKSVEEAAVPAEEQMPDNRVEEMPQVHADKSYLGLGMEPLPAVLAGHLGLAADTGALVRVTDPNGPAGKAGIQAHDIITAVDGQVIKSQECLCRVLDQHKPGDELKVSLIHRGQAAEKSVVLANRPAVDIAGIEQHAAADPAIADDLLEGLPKEMRDMIEKNLNALGGDALGKAQVQILPMGADALPELQKRVEEMMKGMKLEIQPGGHGAGGFNIQPGKANVQMKSSVNMLDDEGKIEINRDGDSAEAKVYDKAGTLLWSGPYQTPQDKEAIPEPIRERLDKLNIDLSGKGIQLKMQRGLPKEK